jgi:HAD superfamily hydrolase (TIGR01509 family)
LSYDLIIFDCDGVLVDSEPIANQLLVECLLEFGQSYSYEDAVRMFVGRPTHVCMSMIEELTGRPLPPDFSIRYEEHLLERLAKEVEPVPGVNQVLDELSVPMCVASNGEVSHVRTSLARVGFLPRFEGRIFSASHVAQPKPAPDLFLHAAAAMGAEPARCAVVEDTILGVTAGVAAGMKVFGYTRTLGALPLKEAGAETFEEMSELLSLMGMHVSKTMPGQALAVQRATVHMPSVRHETVCRIRLACVADAERLLAVRRQAILELAVPTLSPERAEAWATSRDLAWMTTLVSAQHLWLVHHEEVIVGWVAVEGDRLIGLYVDPAYSRRGFGSCLLSFAEHEVWVRGFRSISLEASWNAEPFYLRRGYEPLTDRPAESARPMRKTLG